MTPNPAKPPDGQAAALVAVVDDAGLPPEWTPWVAPSPARWADEEGGDFEHMGSLSVLGRDTLEGGGNVRGTPSNNIISYSLSLSFVYSLFPSPPFLHLYW
jgi:hypothetical protein